MSENHQREPAEPKAAAGPPERDPWAPPADRTERTGPPAQAGQVPLAKPAPGGPAPSGSPAYGAPVPPFGGQPDGLPPAAAVPPPPLAPDGPGPAPGQGPVPGQGYVPGPGGYPAHAPYPAGPMPGWPYIPAPPSNGMGTAAMVLGILSLCLFWMWGIVSIVLGVLALIFGILGRKKARQGLADNGGAALSGIIMGPVGIVLGAAFIALIVWAIATDEDTGSEPDSDESSYSVQLQR
ncbi:DUF4190 domain-containing protein [Streptomyces sp. O3]